jgi:hypothetical protein
MLKVRRAMLAKTPDHVIGVAELRCHTKKPDPIGSGIEVQTMDRKHHAMAIAAWDATRLWMVLLPVP